MKRLLALSLAFAAAAACKPPQYHEPEPEPIEPPPAPIERVIRLPVNYRFRDQATQRVYSMRLYRDEEIEDILVTIMEPGRAFERNATPAETEYAMSVFIGEWVEKSEEDQLGIARRIYDRELARRATLLDEQIRLKEAAIQRLEDLRLEMNADLVASRTTSGYAADPQRLKFLQDEVARLDGRIAMEKAQLQILRYQRYLREQGLDIAKLRSQLGDAK